MTTPQGPTGARKLEWLAGGGEMADLIGAVDWSQSPLGPIELWTQSLRTTVSLALASNFPINIIWGDGHNQIYNDGYRVVCGAVHPRAMGEDYRVTWASAWPAVGEPFERALAGQTSYLENQRMFLERNGYQEETFFTFSLSPIRDESGKVVGLFHPVTETTATMLGERRTRALRDVADGAGRAPALDEACELLLATFAKYELDLPFALLYLTDASGTKLRGARGIAGGGVAAAEGGEGWPLATEDRMLEVDVGATFGPVVADVYPEPVTRAFVLPVRIAGVARPIGFVVVGASPRLPLDEPYRGFIEMLGAAATAALANARGYELERQRAEALAELDRTKTAFFSNVSHEFRTPLTLLLGPVEELLAGRRGELGAEVRNELDVVHRNGVRLLKLVNALLDFSRVEAGQVEASLVTTDLAALTRDVASAFRSAIERAGMALIVDVEELDEPAVVDREMWEKIVLNLVSNAFKFTRKGEIRVTLEKAGSCAELTVADTGSGIPEEEMGRVFERFHRVRGAAGRTHEGSGIGLALVRDLARVHGGSVDVKSTVGEGTAFTVRIPLGDPATARASAPIDKDERRSQAFVEEALRSLPAAPAESQKEVGSRPTVLLADDNADMRDYVRRLLGDKYRVESVSDGAEALAAAERSRPDLILSDVMMPVMDGAELVKRLRAHPTLRTLPIILLSARAGAEETASGLELGADDYLTKPFSSRELLARVNTQLTMASLRRQAAEQDVRTAALEERQKFLQTLIDARDEFLSIASHELKTPLTSVRLQLQLTEKMLATPADAPRVPERIDKLMRVATAQVKRLSMLVDDLLDVARIRTGNLSLVLDSADLAVVVRETLERLAVQLAEAGCSIRVEAPATLLGVWDAARLEQILTNLVTNAIRYAPGTAIEVRLTEEPGGGARLTVRDHGPGVPESLQDSIFDRFDRGVASRNSGGLGLGLYISRQLVKAHRGTIAVETAPGGGARFLLDLPRDASVATISQGDRA